MKLNTIQTGNKNIRKEIGKAIEALAESMEDEYWKDDFYLDLLSAPKFFSEEKKAIKSLEKILTDEKKYADSQSVEEVQEIIDELFQSDVFLTKIIVYDAGSIAARDLKSVKRWTDEISNL